MYCQRVVPELSGLVKSMLTLLSFCKFFNNTILFWSGFKRSGHGTLILRIDKEVLRKMIWQVAAFSGVEVLTYCIMSNHFHVLLRVPESVNISDVELLRRYRILYPKPTKYQTASIALMEQTLAAGGKEALVIRKRLLVRMGDVSEYMKSVKQRFSVWYNRSHQRKGTLWNERFKSVLVEGKGNPLQAMAAYIDLNPVRAGLVADPKGIAFVAMRKPLLSGLC